MLRAAIALAWGTGRVPQIRPDSHPTTFEALERPLGHLGEEVLRPVTAYFEAAAGSRQYAILGRRGWSIVESFRALALAHSIALWLLRLVSTDRSPDVEDAISVVGAIDRGQGYAPLAGRRHRTRLARLARLGELARVVAWYAR